VFCLKSFGWGVGWGGGGGVGWGPGGGGGGGWGGGGGGGGGGVGGGGGLARYCSQLQSISLSPLLARQTSSLFSASPFSYRAPAKPRSGPLHRESATTLPISMPRIRHCFIMRI